MTGSNAKKSAFASLPEFPLGEAFSVNAAYLSDVCPDKVNLGLGVYRSEQGLPWPLPVVEVVERQLQVDNDPFRHEYLTNHGDTRFLELARDLAFGFDETDVSAQQRWDRGRIASVQAISGTGANHLGAKFLATMTTSLALKHVWIPDPTWGNHHTIWDLVGVARRDYPHYNGETNSFDFEGMLRTLESDAGAGDVVLLHACAHNPTGSDPSKDQWMAIADLCERKGLFPFFDLAYQGFASGDPFEDTWVIRHFLQKNAASEFCVAQSFAKNFGLYGQRVGALHVVTSGDVPNGKQLVVSNLCHLISGEYAVPPRAGSVIVRTVLENQELRSLWLKDLTTMSNRIKAARQALYDQLVKLETPGSWEHIVSQIGMFSYTGLSKAQALELRQKYHIYLLSSGRISVPGLTKDNVNYVAKAVDEVVRRTHESIINPSRKILWPEVASNEAYSDSKNSQAALIIAI